MMKPRPQTGLHLVQQPVLVLFTMAICSKEDHSWLLIFLKMGPVVAVPILKDDEAKATNWASFSATAGLGVIHHGHLQQGRSFMAPYLPQNGSSGGSPYSEILQRKVNLGNGWKGGRLSLLPEYKHIQTLSYACVLDYSLVFNRYQNVMPSAPVKLNILATTCVYTCQFIGIIAPTLGSHVPAFESMNRIRYMEYDLRKTKRFDSYFRKNSFGGELHIIFWS
ncbi:26S proteasome regulatory complex component [Artemisia annua]|uniref:26S proteasome regulatory complex component n=1 Tax=Artemisia annua TaxID=35608 RepID=A0A2U1PF44_ARTAN|nr:26S proteasome regulatory complex component [Artemisia annua]